jgi:hypothetical protein
VKKCFTLLILIILSICVGCKSKLTDIKSPISSLLADERVVYIENSYGPYEKIEIINALHSWECNTGNMVKYIIVDNYDYSYSIDPYHSLLILKANTQTPEIKAVDDYLIASKSERRAAGLFVPRDTTHPDRIMLVSERVFLSSYFKVMAHELGHALGLAHDESMDSIMYGHADQNAGHITMNDLIQFCFLYHCSPPKNLNKCYQGD